MKYLILLLFFALTFLNSCEKKEVNPSITTLEANPISVSSCTAKAVINEFGSHAITDHGFVCSFGSSENLNYIGEQNKVSLGKVIPSDTFSTTFTLSTSSSSYYSGYKWYVRSYITNDKGTVYGNSISFDPLVFSLQSISPNSGKIGDTICIYGNNFDPIPGNNTVKFSNYSYFLARVVSATQNLIRVIVPDFSVSSSNSDYFDIEVTVGNQTHTLNDVFLPELSLTSFSPKNGTFNTYISIYGTSLGQISGVMLDNILIYSFYTYRNYIRVLIPNGIASKKFKIYVLIGNNKMEVPGGEFEMNHLTATSFSPLNVSVGNSLTIYGSNFNPSSGNNAIFIGSTKISTFDVYSSYLTINVPQNFANGSYTVSVTNGVDTVTLPDKLIVATPFITGMTPVTGYVNTYLTLTGHNFRLGRDYSIVYFSGSNCDAFSHDSTTYIVNVPDLDPGSYKVAIYNINNKIFAPTEFTVLASTLSAITPSGGSSGTGVVINGGGFGYSSSNIVVKFGSIKATVSTVTNTSINAVVPPGVVAGTCVVSVTVGTKTIAKTLNFSVP